MNLDETNQRYEKALQLIYDLASGKHKFSMSIPANVKCDSDLILSNALKDIPKLIDEVNHLKTKYYDQCDAQIIAFREDATIEATKRCIELTNDCATIYEVVGAIEREFKL